MKLSLVIEALGEPFWRSENCLIYNADCLDAMKRMPLAFADLVVTSPPYNIGKEYEKLLAREEYITWCGEWIGQLHRLTTEHGAFWLNLGYISVPERAKAIPISYLLWQHIPYFLIQEVVWNYGAGVAARKFYSPRNEKFLWYVKDENCYTFNLDDVRDPDVKYPNQKKNGKIKVNPLGKNPSDVWQFPKVTSGAKRSSKERTAHPAQFPEQVIERIIKASSNQGDVILDPFLGSGTTMAVADRLGRCCVGFEINQAYCEIAVERLTDAMAAAALAGKQTSLSDEW